MLAELQRFKKKTYLLPNACQQAGEKQAFIEGALVSLGLDPEKVMAEGRNPASIDEARKRGRAKKIDPADLADEAAVQKTINMYLDYFNRPDESFNVEHLTAGTLWSDANDGDMGVEEMKMKSTDELCSLLGFKDGRPFTWNKYRSLGNIRSAWDTSLESELAMFIDGGEDMELLTLLWHQLVGVAAMASKVWLKDESKKTFGILLADDVGVGKTAQVMAFIAFLQLVYESQVQDVALPALLDGLPSFMGRGKVPNAPHAIIVPNSLIDQWRRELKVFFKPNVIDIFVLPTQAAKLQKFFQEDKDGSWMRSRHEKIRRIVLIPHSVFCSLTGMSYFTDRKGRQDTCVDDQRALKQQAADFFQMEWCTTWIDEAHEFRTISRGFVGAVQLRHKTHMTNACTATPLYTKPEDTINMGRIIGVPGLTMEPGKTFERDGKRHIQRITRSITADDLRDIRAAQEKRLLGHDVPLPDSRKRLADAKVFWVQHIQRLYDGHLIRRDKNSKRPDGSKINDLQPYDMHRIPVTLQDWEIEILSNSMGDVMRSKSDGSLGDITSEVSNCPLHLSFPLMKHFTEILYILSAQRGIPCGHQR
ncbi:hypothetical protein AX14_006173 [Amanita brunnescens Koide BX004]|nr:hypothetical protein AX14_006173 [Amanita brunnescens Koide BX004]